MCQFGRTAAAVRPTEPCGKANSAKAIVVIRGDQADVKEKESDRDPIYGNSLPLTWKWLNAHQDGENDEKLPWIDFGVASIRVKWDETPSGQQSEINAPSSNAPVLFPAHLDCWVQTSPIPMPDPDPAPFLHGTNKAASDVQVVFRSDLGSDHLKWADIVALCPPSSSEAVPVRIGVFRNWLAEKPIIDNSGDVEGESEEMSEDGDSFLPAALLWRGPENSRVISDAGDVLPARRTSYPWRRRADQLGDFPFGLDDLGDDAFLRSRDRALLRLCTSEASRDADDFDDRLTEDVLSELATKSRDWPERAVENLTTPKNRIVEQHPLGGWVLTSKRRLGQFAPEFLDDEASSYSPARAP